MAKSRSTVPRIDISDTLRMSAVLGNGARHLDRDQLGSIAKRRLVLGVNKKLEHVHVLVLVERVLSERERAVAVEREQLEPGAVRPLLVDKVLDGAVQARVLVDGHEPIAELTRLVLLVHVNRVGLLGEHGHIVVNVLDFNCQKTVAPTSYLSAVLRYHHYVHQIGAVLGPLEVERFHVVHEALETTARLALVHDAERALRRTIGDVGRDKCDYAVFAARVLVGGGDAYAKERVLGDAVTLLAVVDAGLTERRLKLGRVHVYFDDAQMDGHGDGAGDAGRRRVVARATVVCQLDKKDYRVPRVQDADLATRVECDGRQQDGRLGERGRLHVVVEQWHEDERRAAPSWHAAVARSHLDHVPARSRYVKRQVAAYTQSLSKTWKRMSSRTNVVSTRILSVVYETESNWGSFDKKKQLKKRLVAFCLDSCNYGLWSLDLRFERKRNVCRHICGLMLTNVCIVHSFINRHNVVTKRLSTRKDK
ncbi:hypothetical protein BpHYR1_027865 [Brachionus plicatilis]|uniref:Uncharacterized protein n=1 Tax=Brachionus plicatilis TaxID=10195 RepID=A0A3M7SAF2_BRAPC|nr:hypothetical protein BpHYR1_027865 [Brachionus plicatilis]